MSTSLLSMSGLLREDEAINFSTHPVTGALSIRVINRKTGVSFSQEIPRANAVAHDSRSRLIDKTALNLLAKLRECTKEDVINEIMV